MQCVAMSEVRFSSASIDAIKDIRRRNELVNVLALALPAGVMVSIFAGNKPLMASYNISQTDFATMSKAMASLPAIHRRVIQNIAGSRALSTTGNESRFWRGIYEGCHL